MVFCNDGTVCLWSSSNKVKTRYNNDGKAQKANTKNLIKHSESEITNLAVCPSVVL